MRDPVETYFTALRDIHASGAGVAEVSYYGALERAGETIVKHRCYLIDGTLQNNSERGLAIVAQEVRPYVVRTGSGSPVRLRRGVPSGPMGPSLGGAGAPEEESWLATDG